MLEGNETRRNHEAETFKLGPLPEVTTVEHWASDFIPRIA